jgi:hypothetical protein
VAARQPPGELGPHRGEHQPNLGGLRPVTLSILDARGRDLLRSPQDKRRETAYIPPGARFGIGDSDYVRRPGATKLTFQLGRPQWLPPNSIPRLTGRFVSGKLYRDDDRYIYAGSPQHTRRHDLTLTYRVDSHVPEVLPYGRASAILRDARGKIVGGTHPADSASWGGFPPGWSHQRINADAVPPTSDLTRTEIYPQPSYFF